MAENSNRSSEPAAGEDLDEVLSEAADATPDSDDERPAKAVTKQKSPAGKVKQKEKEKGPGIFARFIRFVREIVAELQKVIWPTRKELITYTTVVVVFVAIMLSLVGLLDLGFAKTMLLVFGNS